MNTELEKKITEILRPYFLDGWTDPSRGLDLAQSVLDTQPTIIVEIGCFGARSTIALALALKEVGNSSSRIYTIDPWKKEDAMEAENDQNRDWWSNKVDLHDIHRKAMEAIWSLGLDEKIVVIRAASHRVATLFSNIDLLNVDGNHSELSSCRDVNLYLPNVRAGGRIHFDDADWPSTQKALALLDAECLLVSNKGDRRIYRKR